METITLLLLTICVGSARQEVSPTYSLQDTYRKHYLPLRAPLMTGIYPN